MFTKNCLENKHSMGKARLKSLTLHLPPSNCIAAGEKVTTMPVGLVSPRTLRIPNGHLTPLDSPTVPYEHSSALLIFTLPALTPHPPPAVASSLCSCSKLKSLKDLCIFTSAISSPPSLSPTYTSISFCSSFYRNDFNKPLVSYLTTRLFNLSAKRTTLTNFYLLIYFYFSEKFLNVGEIHIIHNLSP